MVEINAYRLNVGSCNGCDIEVVSALASRYGIGNMNVKVVDEPEKANAMIVVGLVTVKMMDHLKEVYKKLKEPRVVISIGACGLTSGIFQKSYSVMDPSDKFVPVVAYVPGCPPSPQVIAKGIAAVLKADFKEWPAPEGFRGLPDLDEKKCTGCNACEKACPAFAIELIDSGNKRTVKYMHDKCISCASCEEVCPYDAVHLAKKRHPAGFQRPAMGVSAVEELSSCPICGNFEIPAKQLPAIADRIIEKVPEYKSYRADIEKAAAVCSKCRGKIIQMGGAKALLFKLGQTAIQ